MTFVTSCNETSTCGDVTEPEVWRSLLAVYLGFILFLSVAINGTLCLVFYKKQHLLNISNCFVLNLACCHLVMSLLVIPCTFYAAVTPDTVFSGPWCDIQGFIYTSIVVTIQIALLVISLDRNYAIMNSLRYPTVFTQKLCTIMIVLSWTIGVIVSVPPLLKSGLGTYKFHRYQFLCTLDWSGTSPYLVVFHVMSFMLPILVQGFCYLKIFRAALGHTRKSVRVYPLGTSSSVKTVRDTTSDSSESCESMRSDDTHHGATQYKAVRTIFIIALAYCICWVPYLIESYLIYTKGVLFPNLSAASICLVFSTGVLNPVIYAYMNRITRREIGRFLCSTPILNDSDDFVSTSMSTFSSAKQAASVWSAQQRMRSRSTGGLNEMDTILEEAEESQIYESRSVGNMHIGEDAKIADHFTQTSSRGKNGEILNVFHLTDKVIPDTTKKISKSVIQTGQLNAPSTSSNTCKAATKSKTRRAESAWNVINTDKFVVEKRRVSKNEGSSWKERRRKRKEYGSFLSFEQDETANNSKTLNHDKRLRKCRNHRLSFDHVQKVSIDSPLPNMLKFRFSVSDIDTHIRKVTVRSNVEIQNKPASTSIDIDQESSSCDPFTPVFDEILSNDTFSDDKNKSQEGASQASQCTSPSEMTAVSCLHGHTQTVSPGHVFTDVWGQSAYGNEASNGGITPVDYDDMFVNSRSISARRSV